LLTTSASEKSLMCLARARVMSNEPSVDSIVRGSTICV
jgi:hypothetical protein